MHIAYPFHFDSRGRTAESSDQDHIREMIEQILFTAPGERVNQPDFGCGVPYLVFEPNSDSLKATTQVVVQSALQKWMGDVIDVEGVDVQSGVDMQNVLDTQNTDAILSISVQYVVRNTQERFTNEFTFGGINNDFPVL